MSEIRKPIPKEILKEEYDPNIIYAIKSHRVYTLIKEDDFFHWRDSNDNDLYYKSCIRTFDRAMEEAKPCVVEEFETKELFEEWVNQ